MKLSCKVFVYKTGKNMKGNPFYLCFQKEASASYLVLKCFWLDRSELDSKWAQYLLVLEC